MIDLSTGTTQIVAVLRIKDEEYALDARNKEIVAGFLYGTYGEARCPDGSLLYKTVSEWCKTATVGQMFVTNGITVKICNKF